MGDINLSLIVTVASIVIIALGFLLGLLRGRNRSIVRLILVIISAIVAISLRRNIVDAIMHVNIGEDTLANSILSLLFTGEITFPEKLIELLFALIEIVIGLIAFYLIFFVLLFITWALVFPIIKIFVKKGVKKGVLFGGIVGLIQGVLIAILTIAPISGLIYEVSRISHIKLNNEDLFELPAEMHVEEYLNSSSFKIYNKTGWWIFEIMSTTHHEDIEDLTLDEIIDTTDSVMKVAGLVTDLSQNMDNMNPDQSAPKTQVDTMKDIGETLIEVGNNIDSLSDNSKQLVNSLVDAVKELITPEGETLPPEIEETLDNFDIDSLDLVGAGTAINGIATYIEKTSSDFDNNEPVTQEDVDNIVNGLAANEFIIKMIAGETSDGELGNGKIAEIDNEHADMFTTAIESSSLTAEDKLALKSILGLA
ncbi:MAG: hypothetical protein E7342_04780 [Clostridiales bacterium]|nr:hypothetical protein [Clostridiales bacterium]